MCVHSASAAFDFTSRVDPKSELIGSRDSTVYTCWTAPSFAAHHGMCISAQCVYADALLLSLGAMRMKSDHAIPIGNIADRPSAILPIDAGA